MRRSVLCALLAVMGCGGGTDGVRLDLDTRDAGQMVAFYTGVFGGGAEILHADGTLDLDAAEALDGDFGRRLRAVSADGRVDRDEFLEAVTGPYARAAGLPASLDELRARWAVGDDSSAWFTHEVSGSMTRFRRRLHIHHDAVQGALSKRLLEGAALTYEPGTVVIGEHLDQGLVVETTVMLRRPDGFWTFGAYGADGARVDRIEGDPDALRVPADCFGCHYGTRQFEPERSFPGLARPGPHGERAVDVPMSWRNAEVTALLQEHARRSDGLLGLYGTLYLSRLLETDAGGDSLEVALRSALDGS